MKYSKKLKSTKIHFTRSLRYISIVLICSTMEVYGVIGGNIYEDVFKQDIYDVSKPAQERFEAARDEKVDTPNKYLAGLAHEAARVYEEGSDDYLAVATLYYKKFQYVHDRFTSHLIESRNLLEGIKIKLTELHKGKATWGKASDILKGAAVWASSSVAMPTIAVPYAALSLFSYLSSNRGSEEFDLNRDINEVSKTIGEINKKIAQAEEGVVNEPIKELEETYVKQKITGENFIKKDLQDTIEGQLINSRKPLYPFPWVKKCLENALKLPHTHKRLTFRRLEDFRRDEFFQKCNAATFSELEDIAHDLVCSSQALDTSKVPLRSICYVHGKPGIGKTEAINRLAKFFDLPFIQENIISVNDLNKDNLVGMDALTPGSTTGWLSRALLATNSEGTTYQNSILILDEFDRILLDKNSGATGLGFFLDFLDPRKKSFYSPYFNAEVDISRMHIFVTGNSEIPDTPEYQALRERFTQTIAFEPMGREQRKEVLEDYLSELGERHGVSEEDLSIQSNYLIDGAITLANDPSSLRECKNQLQNIVRDFRTGGRSKVHKGIQEREKKKIKKSNPVVKKTKEEKYVADVSEEIASAEAIQSSIRANAIELGVPLEVKTSE